jgi:hypothetical protein
MRKEKSKVLQQNKKVLYGQEKKINTEIDKYDSINQEQIEQSVKLTQNYAHYLIFLLLFVIALILFIKMNGRSNVTPMIQSGGNLSNKTYYGVFIVILFAIIIYTMYVK